MYKFIYLLAVLVFFSSCSSKPISVWQSVAKANTDYYMKARLSGDEVIAQSAYDKAKNACSQAGDVETCQRLELLKGALSFILGEKEDFTDYTTLKNIEPLATHEAYYSLLTGKNFDTEALPKGYKKFVKLLGQNDQNALHELIREEESIRALIYIRIMEKKGMATVATWELGFEKARFEGWQKTVLLTLDKALGLSTEEKQKKNLTERIRLVKESYGTH